MTELTEAFSKMMEEISAFDEKHGELTTPEDDLDEPLRVRRVEIRREPSLAQRVGAPVRVRIAGETRCA